MLLALSACNREHYTTDLAFTGNLQNIRELIADGYFYKEHIYTIYLNDGEIGVGQLSDGDGFTLPVIWQFDPESCTPLTEPNSAGAAQLYVVQGQPLEDGGPLSAWFFAEIIDADTLQTCGEARTGFRVLERWYRVDL